MRVVTEEIKLFTFKEASTELREKIRSKLDVDGFLYEHCMEERINTLQEYANFINGTLDYDYIYISLGRIRMKLDTENFEKEVNEHAKTKLLKIA